MKSEPDTYSYADLEADGSTYWEGVRNYVARNAMRAMKTGDRVFFYHSQMKPPGIAGVAEVVEEAYPDHTAWEVGSKYFDPKSTAEAPRWDMVDLAPVQAFEELVSLVELKANPALEGMAVTQKGQRVSVLPVTEAEYEEVVRMAAAKATS